MPLTKLKINKYSVLFLLLVLFIFIEIIIMSPSLLEKKDDDGYTAVDKAMPQDPQKKKAIEQKMQGVHLVENNEREKGWELFANEAVGTNDFQWIVKNVRVKFFNENKATYTVTGDIGEIEGESKDMIIRGNVKTSSTNGYSFKTDTLRYLAKQKIMTSLDAVLMEGPPDKTGNGFKLTGEKLLVDIVKNKMSILDRISATKNINKKDFKLTSVRADFSNKSQEAIFSGDVKMNLGSFNVKAPLANFNYSNNTKSLTRIILKQGVEFVDADRNGTCDELEMDLAENKMTMRGQPKVQQGEDEIRGQEIVFLDGGKKVKINKIQKQGKP
jgi:LPS export ABC transporter protein LptC/lipopolysaccharide transport protein LptA